MQVTFWSGDVANFGDALNAWLWPLLIPDVLDDDPRELFVGIGSILYDDYPRTCTKIVFGAGYGGYGPPPFVDASWDVRFVRGPRTAAALGIDPEFALGDPAALVSAAGEALPWPDGRHAVGFMPHWESALYGAWEPVCRELGVRFIDPRGDVKAVIAAIRSCDVLVSEALHGAIVADALRVPWVPFAPAGVHHEKWYDWAESQGLELRFAPSARSTFFELLPDRLRSRGFRFRHAGSRLLRRQAATAICNAAAEEPRLTDPARLAATTRAMLAELDALRYQKRATNSSFIDSRQSMFRGTIRSTARTMR